MLDSDRIYIAGEKEALTSDTMKIFTLFPERKVESDAAQMHFRIAESQFYRLLASGSSGGVKVVKVEYVVNPPLVKKFEEKRLQLATSLDWEQTKPILCFHGTSEDNIPNIIKNNFDVNFVGKSTDKGCYGAGIYLSEYPALSMAYVRKGSKFLLCKVLLGKVFKCTSHMMGAPCKTGYNSHISPNGQEIVIFDTDQILPTYIVHYTTMTNVQTLQNNS